MSHHPRSLLRVGLIMLAFFLLVTGGSDGINAYTDPELPLLLRDSAPDRFRQWLPVRFGFAAKLLGGLLLLALNRPLARWFFHGAGFCSHCGYDLRDSATEHCPECGHVRPPGPNTAQTVAAASEQRSSANGPAH